MPRWSDITAMESGKFSKTHLPQWRIWFSEQNELLNPSLLLYPTQERLVFNFNSKYTDWLLFSQFSKQKKKRHVTDQEISKFDLKIFVNKMSSDLAENLRAVRPPGPLTAHKISAKSDNVLLTKIFEQNFLVHLPFC